MTNLRNYLFALLSIFALAYGSTPQPTLAHPSARAQTTPSSSAVKTESFLRQSGYKYQKLSGEVWIIKRQGENISDLQMLVATGSDFVIVGVIVAVKKDIRATPAMYQKLLKLNHSQDYVKIGFDDDDDLFVRTEVRTRTLDLQDFKATVERVAAAADKVYGDMSPFIITQPTTD